VRSFVIRDVLLHPVVAPLLLFLATSVAIHLRDGDRSWKVGFVAGALFALSGGVLALARSHLSTARARLRSMVGPVATFALRQEGMTMACGAGNWTLRWPCFVGVHAGPVVWTFFLVSGEFFIVPTGDAPAEALTFIRTKVRTVA
jgi:hypothetical protein